jgi:hypothetical protein
MTNLFLNGVTHRECPEMSDSLGVGKNRVAEKGFLSAPLKVTLTRPDEWVLE